MVKVGQMAKSVFTHTDIRGFQSLLPSHFTSGHLSAYTIPILSNKKTLLKFNAEILNPFLQKIVQTMRF